MANAPTPSQDTMNHRRTPQRRSLGSSLGTSGLGVIVGFIVVALVIVGIGVSRAVSGHSTSAASSSAAAQSSSAPATGGSGPASTSPGTSSSTGTGSAGTSSVGSSSSVSTAALEHIAVPKLSKAQLAALPQATTFTTVAHAVVNLHSPSGGQVVGISSPTAAFRAPGKEPIAVIPSTEIGTATWLPVIGHKADWVRVRLPSRPNGATAWLPEANLATAQTSWSVTVDLGAGTLTIDHGGDQVGTWPVGHGKDSTPTPVGQTFLMASFSDPDETYSPVIYATGAHSNTLDSYGGGPGTVAVHGWPTEAGRIGKVSHGCVRVPADALQKFSLLPIGTPISIEP